MYSVGYYRYKVIIISLYIKFQHWSDKIHSLFHWGIYYRSLHEHGFGGNFSVGWSRVGTRVRLPRSVRGQNFVVGNHEGFSVEVSVGDGVHSVDLGIVFHPHVVVAGVGRQSEENNSLSRITLDFRLTFLQCRDLTFELVATWFVWAWRWKEESQQSCLCQWMRLGRRDQSQSWRILPEQKFSDVCFNLAVNFLSQTSSSCVVETK